MRTAKALAIASSVASRLMLLFLLFGVVAGFRPAPLAAQNTIALEATAFFDGNYTIGEWLPLSIVLRNSSTDTQVTLAATSPNADSRSTMPVDLPGGGEKRFTFYVAMPLQTSEIRLSVEQNGTALAEQTLTVRPRAGERSIGVVANTPLNLRLPTRQELFADPFLPVNLPAAHLPDNPVGLSSLMFVLLHEAPTADWSEAQRRALWTWVYAGGHLVISGGTPASAALAGVPEGLRAASLGGPTNLDAAVLGGAEPPTSLVGVSLTPLPSAISVGAADAPLLAQRRIGSGIVTQLAFDPLALNDWSGAEAFWDQLLQPALALRNAGVLSNSPDSFRETNLSNAISQLPSVALPNSSILFTALALYAVLIGPGVALLLRRLDRQSAAWVVLPAVALLTTGLMVGFALSLRADQRIINQVTLVEQFGPDFARARTVAAILSPQDATFQATVNPASANQQLRPVPSDPVAVEAVLGDIGQQAETVALSVDAWKLQGILSEATIDLPTIEAQMTISGTVVQAVVRNPTDQTLRDVTVLYGEQRVRVGDLAPGEQGVATLPPVLVAANDRPQIGIDPMSLLFGEALEQMRQPGQRADRRLLARSDLVRAATARGSIPSEQGPLVFAWMEQSPLPVAVAADSAARQETTLLVVRPRIVGTGQILTPLGWLRIDPLYQAQACSSDAGLGVGVREQYVTALLSLPDDMAQMRASQINLWFTSERPWPNAGVTTEIFNWQNNSWLALGFDGPGDLALAQADEFFANGRVLVRLGGRISEAGCVTVEGQVGGSFAP